MTNHGAAKLRPLWRNRPRFGIFRRQRVRVRRWVPRLFIIVRIDFRKLRLRRSGVRRAYRHVQRLLNVLLQQDLAFTAVAAPPASLTEMVAARVLSAARTNSGRFFRANCARKGHGSNYFFLPLAGLA